MENQLVTLVNQSGLEKTKAQVLLEQFGNYFEIAQDWKAKADALVITSVDQKAEMKMAGEGRKFLKDKRVSVEKTRKALKDSALKEGQAIDSIARFLTSLIEPIEKDLESKEKFAEIQEKLRKEKLRNLREWELQPYSEFISLGLDLENMAESDYQKLLFNAKQMLADKKEADKKAEEERIAKIEADRLERERIKAENDKLQAEVKAKEAEAEKVRIASEKALAEERAKAAEIQRIADENARAERDAKIKAEAEAQKLRDAEELRLRQLKADEEKKAKEAEELAKAPDKEKLREWIGKCYLGITPSVDGKAHAKACEIQKKHAGFLIWANEQIDSL